MESKKLLFIKYKYIIKDSVDVTSSQYEFNTKYPVYTLITYKNTGQLLSICPGSHKTCALFIFKWLYYKF